MLLENFPSELILQIYTSCSSVQDVLNLSLTCRRMHHLLPSSKRISIFFSIMENEAGPILDMIQFLTINDSQPAHTIRQPPPSLSLLRQVVSVSRVAHTWEEFYPLFKWRDDYTERRALNTDERFRLRRAMYRLWLFSRAFHNPLYPRQSRLQAALVEEKSRLVRNWSTEEIAEIEDFRNVMRTVLQSTCDSNDMLHYELLPSYIRPSHYNINASTMLFHSSQHGHRTPEPGTQNARYVNHSISGHAWGTEMSQASQYYVLEDLMKLDPSEVMWVHENVRLDWHLQTHLQALGKGEWFENNGETFGQTIETVLSDRGEDIHDVHGRVAQQALGIVKRREDSLPSLRSDMQ